MLGAGMIFQKEPFFHGHDNYDQLVKIAKVCTCCVLRVNKTTPQGHALGVDMVLACMATDLQSSTARVYGKVSVPAAPRGPAHLQNAYML